MNYLAKTAVCLAIFGLGVASGLGGAKVYSLRQNFDSQESFRQLPLRRARVLFENFSPDEFIGTIHGFAAAHDFAIRISPMRPDNTFRIDLLRRDIEISISFVSKSDLRAAIYQGNDHYYERIPFKKKYLDELIHDLELRIASIEGANVVEPLPDRPGITGSTYTTRE